MPQTEIPTSDTTPQGLTELPFLLRLVDDPSEAVRTRVKARLRALGSGVWPEIERLGWELTAGQRAGLEQALALDPNQALTEAWSLLQEEDEDLRYLESALLLIADWQDGTGTALRGEQLLDELAEEFAKDHLSATAQELAVFLFGEKKFRGAPAESYYSPRNSNLVAVLETGVGLPITLTCLFILVGGRCDLPIEGCNFPGHFLARDGRERTLFDPYNGGRILVPGELEALRKAAPEEMDSTPSAREITVRVLRNLSLAYHHQGEGARAAFMLSLGRQINEG